MTFLLGQQAEIAVVLGSGVGTEEADEAFDGFAQFSTLMSEFAFPSEFCAEKICPNSFYNPALSVTQEGYNKFKPNPPV
jgi:hypothetical protein